MSKPNRAGRKAQRQVAAAKATPTADSFANFAARLGYGAKNNLASHATYTRDYISHNRQLLENMYDSSWVIRKCVDVVAEDATKKGIDITSLEEASEIEELMAEWSRLAIWTKLCSTIKWARLYGGAVAVMLIDGQDLSTPLRIASIGKDQFKGLAVLDRWVLQPTPSELVTEYGPNFGLPKYYQTVSDPLMPIRDQKIHHSRVIRIEGPEVPFYRREAEQLWGVSVAEPVFDRVLAYDSTSVGIAQLVYKAHLRVLKIQKYRDSIAMGGEVLESTLKQIEMIRAMQTNEGMTVLDGTDEYQAHNYTFSGLDNVLIQFGQQLSGATGIPMTKLFGQSPAGLNATGESDLENYNGTIHQEQETKLRTGVGTLLEVSYRSVFARAPKTPFAFKFRPLKEMSETDKANIAATITTAVCAAESQGIIDAPTAAQELRHAAAITGVFTHITDKAIKDLENAEPPTPELDAPEPEEDDPDADSEEK